MTSSHLPSFSLGASYTKSNDSSLYDDSLDHPHLDPPSLSLTNSNHYHNNHHDSIRRRRSSPPSSLLSSPYSTSSSSSHRQAHPIHYAFAQAFGEREVGAPAPVFIEDSDMISSVAFNFDSEMIATGDKGGRIVILKRVHRKNSNHTSNSNPNHYSSTTCLKHHKHVRRRKRRVSDDTQHRRPRNSSTTASASNGYGGGGSGSGFSSSEEEGDDSNGSIEGRDNMVPMKSDMEWMGRYNNAPEFKFWTQFQSHESEFDYLKSMEIEEKINQICWCRQAGPSHRLIATNDKTIKVWRVAERQIKSVTKISPQYLRKSGSTATPPPSLSPSSSTSSSSSSSSSSLSYGIPSSRNDLTPPSTIISNHHRHHHHHPVLHTDSATTNFSFPTDLQHHHHHRRRIQHAAQSIRMPRLEIYGSVVTATPRRIFSDADAYHINSISLNSDEVTLLSSDDLRIHLWNLEAGGVGFNILDAKPCNMEDLTEVITSAQFHPNHCHLLGYASSRGTVKVCDLRVAALCDSPTSIKHAKKFEVCSSSSSTSTSSMNGLSLPPRRSFFSEIITSISDVRFSPDGRYLLTRDYMNLRLWDLHMERKPIRVIPVHDHLRLRLCDLYENNCIFDKFQCRFSSDGGSLLTGSYNSLFQSYSASTGLGSAVEASVDYVSGHSTRYNTTRGHYGNMIGSGPIELLEPKKRIMTLDSSTTEQIAAVASGPALYVYHAPGRSLT